MNLALFDFDGTITYKDSYTGFIKFSVKWKRLIAGLILLMPVIIGYKLKLLSSAKTRQIITYFSFHGCSHSEINELGLKYSGEIIPLFIRNIAIEKIQWHKQQGDKIVIVSASINIYLKHWCEKHGLDLICSELEIKENKLTGNYINGDCSGKKKSERILEKYDLQIFNKIYAYGDTIEDKEMFDLADIKYLRWKEFKNDTPMPYLPNFENMN
ncbi:MAG: HAD-IB family hydrolase [Spirochaetes bacterium]|nr:HAD-IB family hydrolase [Spirochaetota bacterium]